MATHPLRVEARGFFRETLRRNEVLVTSAEVLQELLHADLTVGRLGQLEAALRLVQARVHDVGPVEEADVRLARTLAERHRGLGARDLLHLACCQRRRARSLQTCDRTLAAAMGR